MIVSLHVASGALAGAAAGSRLPALLLGPCVHALGDWMRHEDIDSRRFEAASGAFGLLLLVVARGPLDPATLGALTSSAPDVEHVLPLPRPGGRKLFPSHRWDGWHRTGGLSAEAQLVAAGVILAALAAGVRLRR